MLLYVCSGLPAREHVFGKQEEGYLSLSRLHKLEGRHGQKSGGFPTHECSEVSH